MHKKMVFRMIWGISLVVVFSLACGLVDQIAGVKNTAESVGTGVAQGVEMLGTGQAIVTEFEGSGIMETAQSVVTDIPIFSTERPEDIPVMEGATSLAGGSELVSYIIDGSLQSAVDFYKQQMPANGWIEIKVEVKEGYAELKYEKGTRTAEITITEIPFIGQTNITIEIKE